MRLATGEEALIARVVAPNGRIDLVFLDRRNDPENLRNDAYFTWSEDGGRT